MNYNDLALEFNEDFSIHVMPYVREFSSRWKGKLTEDFNNSVSDDVLDKTCEMYEELDFLINENLLANGVSP